MTNTIDDPVFVIDGREVENPFDRDFADYLRKAYGVGEWIYEGLAEALEEYLWEIELYTTREAERLNSRGSATSAETVPAGATWTDAELLYKSRRGRKPQPGVLVLIAVIEAWWFQSETRSFLPKHRRRPNSTVWCSPRLRMMCDCMQRLRCPLKPTTLAGFMRKLHRRRRRQNPSKRRSALMITTNDLYS